MPRSSPIAALPDRRDDLSVVHSLAATGPTIAECRERYRRWLRAQNLRPATIGLYSSALDDFERFLTEKGMPQTLRAIRREHVEDWVEWLQRRPGRKGATASQSWVSLSFRGLQPFWKWAIDGDEIDASPMARMKRPVVDEVVKPSLTLDQLDALLKTHQRPDLREPARPRHPAHAARHRHAPGRAGRVARPGHRLRNRDHPHPCGRQQVAA